jgi:hypothetical protein
MNSSRLRWLPPLTRLLGRPRTKKAMEWLAIHAEPHALVNKAIQRSLPLRTSGLIQDLCYHIVKSVVNLHSRLAIHDLSLEVQERYFDAFVKPLVARLFELVQEELSN